MPELPEVETVRAGLAKILKKSRIEGVELRRKDLRFPFPRGLSAAVTGQPVQAVRRRAKYLLIEIPDFTILSHLGMTGSWRLAELGDERKHDHLLFLLSGDRRLVYNDPRRFGFVDLVPKGEEQKSRWLQHLGVEPLDRSEFTAKYLHSKMRQRQAPVKNVIMDQRVVVGVGNIYASEALFRAGIHPEAPARRLSLARVDRLLDAIYAVLTDAIVAGGTTIKDFRQAGGSEGSFQNKLDVYGRKGESCEICSSVIKSKMIGGRNTFWCGRCQRK